ncbi:MAG: ester cyclase [Chitinophagaceae bacterium]|nr:ester cyclase [Chitinophagaceae bacterium]
MKFIRLITLTVIMCMAIEKVACQDKDGNKVVARFYIEEIVNKQKLELLNQVFADSFLVHILTDSTQNLQSIEAQADFLKYLFKAFPDIHYTVGDIIGDGDKIAMRVTLSATHKDEFWGYKASGNRINHLSEIFFFRFINGKVVESWVQIDLYNLYRQLKGEK